jgi:hypothetical protein
MGDLMLWLTGHRVLVVGLVAASLWVTAYYLYFKKVLIVYLNRSKPRSWALDMVNKQPVTRGHRNSH